MTQAESRSERARPAAGSRSGMERGLLFLGGLLLGWWLLGWWLFPVEWGPASVMHLEPGAKSDYVRLVANQYAQDGDIAGAREYLKDLEPADLRGTLLGLSGQQHAESRSLALNLGISLEEAAREATAAAAGAAPALDDGQAGTTDIGQAGRFERGLITMLGLGIVGALAALLLILLSLNRWRQQAAGQEARRARRPETAPSMPPAQAPTSPPPASAEDPGLEATRAMPSQAQAQESAQTRDPAGPPAAPESETSATHAPAWQPARIELGQTVDARYVEGEQPPIRTWLVYDERGALVGGAGLLAQSIGGVNTLDLWFSDRDDVDQTTKTPTVTFVSKQAHDDPVLRARLADRRLVAAVPGRSLKLETVDLLLEVGVLSVDPAADSGQASLRSVALAMKALPHPSTGKQRALAAEPDSETSLFDAPAEAEAPNWDASLDDDIDDAFDPPRPLPFQKD